MSKPFKGVINLGIRDSTPDWEPYEQPKAPDGAPNVLFVVWDDTGFGATSPFGGPIEMPTLQRLADQGLRYAQFHTTAICSPTRASMLTGRNHTTVGMACIAEATTGFPGSNGHIPFETATIAEVLGERGYNTYMLGKWHCCPEDETNMASSKRNWPTGRGFERYYGFLGGETNAPTGRCVLGVEFTKESQTPGATTGSLALFIDDRKVGELADVMIQNGKFSLCGEGLNIGRDGGAPVTDDYPFERPWALVGVTIDRVVVNVSGEPYVDLEKEALAMMKRD